MWVLLAGCFLRVIAEHLLHPFFSNLQISGRGLLGLLNESMKQEHARLFIEKQDTTNTSMAEIASYLPNSSLQRSAQWHTDRSRIFNRGNIFANSLAIF